MRKIKKIGRIFSIILTVLLTLALISNLYIICAKIFTEEKNPTFFGFSSAVVISGSMSGSIEINDMVITGAQKEYEVGDIITFESGNSLVTHRIVEKTESGFITKGDANNAEDIHPVSEDCIIGKVVFIIPKIGWLIEYLKTPLGMTCFVLIGFLVVEISSFVKRKQEDKGTRGGNDDGE